MILKHIYNSSSLCYLCRTDWGFNSPPFPLSGNTLPAEPCGMLPPSGSQGGCRWPRQQHPSSSQGCPAPKQSHSQGFQRLSSALFIQNQTISAPSMQHLPQESTDRSMERHGLGKGHSFTPVSTGIARYWCYWTIWGKKDLLVTRQNGHMAGETAGMEKRNDVI